MFGLNVYFVLCRSKYSGTVSSVPMVTCLSSCDSAHKLLASLKDNFLRVNLSQHHTYSLSRDSQGDIVQALDKLSSNYRLQTAQDVACSDDED